MLMMPSLRLKPSWQRTSINPAWGNMNAVMSVTLVAYKTLFVVFSSIAFTNCLQLAGFHLLSLENCVVSFDAHFHSYFWHILSQYLFGVC
jgi:hypothetical protein